MKAPIRRRTASLNGGPRRARRLGETLLRGRAGRRAMLARHCARCGHATERFEEHGYPRTRCPACRWVDYGNPKPAAGAIVPRGGKVLLSKRAREPKKGAWDLPGGFLEAGEEPEAAIVRELDEETGMRARVVRLVHVGAGVYADEATLNLVYLCEAEGEPRAMDDSSELRFWDPREMPTLAWPHEEEAVRRWLRER